MLPVFLDLSKAWNTVDRIYLLITLKEYGAGPRMCGILETFWKLQQMIPRQNNFHMPYFPVTRGTKHGGLVSLTLFNVLVDNIIRTWLTMMVKYHRVNHYIMGETVGR